MSSLLRFSSLAVVVVWAYACATDRAARPPVTGNVGRFQLAVYPDTARFTIAGPDGKPLVDGLDASDAVGTPQSQNDAAPPMTGFAVRRVATTYEMEFGSFKSVDDQSAPWVVARTARWAGGDAPVELLGGDGGVLATLHATQGRDDGHLEVDVAPGDAAPASSDPAARLRVSWGFRCDAADRFYGFGAQTWGVGARGETIPVWVQEEGVGKDLTTDDPTGIWFLVGRRHSTGAPMPEFFSRRGFVAVAETDHPATFALCSERDDVARMELELPVTVHLFHGPSPAEAVGRATAEFGRPRVPPAFAFAPWNDAIFGSATVRATAKELRDAGIPSSVIWTEDWRGGAFDQADSPDHYALKEEWDVDRSLYPDFEQVAQELHAQGFKWLVYFNPFVEQGSAAFPETAPNGLLIRGADGNPYLFADAKGKQASMVDLTKPEAVAWAVGKMKAAIALGADGWMGDFSEWLPTDAVLAGGSGLDLHDQYPVLWQKAQRQALDESMAADGVERLSFVRAAWLGSTPLVDVFWPGDQRTTFAPDDGMPNVVPMGADLGLSGISTYGSDVGGYQSATNPPSTKELFFRWTELGAWSPVMRTHHGSAPKLNWRFDSDQETLAHWARYAKLHMALAPYLRGLAQAAHDTGLSIWRALPLAFPDDDAVWPIADEVMVGDGVLVAPVQVEAAIGRNVYLPAGDWYPWSGGSRVAGRAARYFPAPHDEIPVFARAGTVVPTYPDGVQTLVKEPSSAPGADSAKDDRVVYAFVGENGQFAESPDSGGLSYALTSSSAPTSGPYAARWNGAPLDACASPAVAPCVEVTPDGVRAHVIGPGSLVVSAGGADIATLAANGGAATRALLLIVRV